MNTSIANKIERLLAILTNPDSSMNDQTSIQSIIREKIAGAVASKKHLPFHSREATDFTRLVRPLRILEF